MKTNESLKSQVQRLADHILNNCEGYPNENEGAIDCAIRIIKASTPTNQQGVSAEEFYKEYVKGKGKGAITLNVIEFAEAYHNQASGNQQRVTDECWDIYLTEMGIGLKERGLILKRLQLPEGEGKEIVIKDGGEPQPCPYCKEPVDYLNYKEHLYMSCTPSHLTLNKKP